MGTSIRVTLTESELHLAKLIAKQKNEWSRRRGHKFYPPDPSGRRETLGIEGERAASLIFVLPRANKEFEPDIGGFIEVKTATKRNALLRWYDRLESELMHQCAFVLMTAEDRPTFRYRGWAWASDFFEKGKKWKGNRGDWDTGLSLEQSQLRSVWSLFHEIDRRNLKREVNEIKNKNRTAI